VGNDLVLMPGAMIALQQKDQRVLLTKRADDGTWCLPAGAAEAGGSFAQTAIDELAEEAGVTVSERDLIPFAAPPKPLHPPTVHALEMLATYLRSGSFQVR